MVSWLVGKLVKRSKEVRRAHVDLLLRLRLALLGLGLLAALGLDLVRRREARRKVRAKVRRRKVRLGGVKRKARGKVRRRKVRRKVRRTEGRRREVRRTEGRRREVRRTEGRRTEVRRREVSGGGQAGFGPDLPLDLLHLGGRLVLLVVHGLLLLRQCSGSRLVCIHAVGVWRCV